jgi:transcriptional regulator with XRE-family HTH domain
MELGTRIRRLRQRQQRTLQEIADECGFTRSLLSKIETGRTVPPVATLSRIAAALAVSVSALMGESQATTTHHVGARDVAGQRLVKTAKGYSFFPFASGHTEKLMQPFLFVARKGAMKGGALSHTGEEFVYVLEGSMKYRIGPVEYALSPGDSLYFDSSEPHDVTPTTDVVTYLAIFVEPQRPRRARETKGSSRSIDRL